MSPARMDRLEAGVRTVIAFIEGLNRGDIPAMMALLSDDCLLVSASPSPDGSQLLGKAAITVYFQDMFAASSQVQVKIEEAFGFGYRCILRWRMDWTDTAGSTGHTHGADIYRLQDGMIREILSYTKA